MASSDPNDSFFQRLKREIPLWSRLGFIDGEQGERILDYYRQREAAEVAPSAAREGGVSSRLPAIMIGIAVLLIGTGIILFYAANWRKMSPTFKLIQIAVLLLSTYGAAFYFLLIEKKRLLVGRGLLMIGMLAYGASIGLVAQIFHISSHPVNGLLLWYLSTFAIAAVVQERWGYYLALLQGLIWNSWRYTQYDDPNFVFLALIVALGYLFYRAGEGVGLVLSVVQFMIWYYQINHYFGTDMLAGDSANEPGFILFIYSHIPLGLVLVLAQRIGLQRDFLRTPLSIVNFAGWVLVFGPLLALSWPMKLNFSFFWDHGGITLFAAEYAILLIMAGGLIYFARTRGGSYAFPALCAGFALVLPFLPMGHQTTFLIVTHLGIIAFIAGSLYYAYTEASVRAERVLALLLAVLALAAKGFGFFIFGVAEQEEFFIAYCLGFVIFATVIFLVNQFVRHAVNGPGATGPFPHGVLSAAAAFGAFWIIYALSFQIEDQRSIFTASAVVLTLLTLFITLAVALFVLLAIRGSERVPLVLAALVFVTSVLVLLSAGPEVPWQYYSVVFNLLLFIMVGVMIYYSTVVNSVLLANLAIAGLVLQVVTRYFDLFWDLLSGSALFIVTGILLFGGGYLLERQRSRLVARIEAREEEA